MKRKITLIMVCVLLLGLVGCGTKVKLPNNPIVFETTSNEEYLSIVWNNKEYVPYCSFDPAKLGDCVGYYEDDNAEKIYVCKLKGYSSDEWLVSTLGLNNCNEGMIFREKNTTTIPKGLSSDYDWNK